VDAISGWARERGVKVVIDAAQAEGAVGGAGDAVAWSFYPTKVLGALGDGGAVTTNDPEVATRLRQLRSYGADAHGDLVDIGRSSRLDELQAAFLRVKLPWVERFVAARRAQAARYASGLDASPLVLPAADGTAGWHQYVVRVGERDRVQAGLLRAGVETKVHYPRPPYLEPAFAGARGRYPVADRLADEVLSLPMGLHLTSGDQEHVIAALRAVLGEQPPRTADVRPATA
jgi:dTDP-3-amino-3,4,6-trideoxy-alpha-D-glucose transaminase